MADVVFNVAKGRLAYYASLPGTNDALIAVPLEATGLEADATIIDHDTLALILAGTSNAQTDVGRKTLTGVAATVDDANNRVNIDSDNIVWTAPPAGNAVGALVVCYDPDTTGGDDTALIPLTKHDVTWTPDGNDFTLTVNDFARAT